MMLARFHAWLADHGGDTTLLWIGAAVSVALLIWIVVAHQLGPRPHPTGLWWDTPPVQLVRSTCPASRARVQLAVDRWAAAGYILGPVLDWEGDEVVEGHVLWDLGTAADDEHRGLTTLSYDDTLQVHHGRVGLAAGTYADEDHSVEHELGHVFGLRHNAMSGQVMNPDRATGGLGFPTVD